jgi:hypothetical protein
MQCSSSVYANENYNFIPDDFYINKHLLRLKFTS